MLFVRIVVEAPIMGRASSRKKHPRAAPPGYLPPGYVMAPCAVCGQDWPWPTAFASGGSVPRKLQVRICQVCLVADLERVLRECPERFCYSATIRALRGLPPVVVWGRSGDEAKAAEKKLKIEVDAGVVVR